MAYHFYKNATVKKCKVRIYCHRLSSMDATSWQQKYINKNNNASISIAQNKLSSVALKQQYK